MPRPIARWNPARDVWEATTSGLFCEHSDVFSETWPTSGMTRSGVAYPLPPWAAPTSAGESSSLLPTPTASDYGNNQSPSPGAAVRPSLSSLARTELLPTPRTSDTNGAGQHGDGGLDLRTVASSLLPTPKAREGDASGRTMSTSTAAKRYAQGRRDLDDAIALLVPTPTAADAERTSLEMVRGNPTLLGAVSTGESSNTPSDDTSG